MKKTCICKNITFNKYEIDYDTGLIYRKGKNEPMKCFDNGLGYDLVDLMSDNGEPIRVKRHFVSAHTFLGPQPENTIINHINGIKKDCRPKNLEYISQRGNVEHAQRLIKGKEYYGDPRMWEKVDAMVAKGRGIAEIARVLDVPYYIIRDRLYGKTYQFNDKK